MTTAERNIPSSAREVEIKLAKNTQKKSVSAVLYWESGQLESAHLQREYCKMIIPSKKRMKTCEAS